MLHIPWGHCLICLRSILGSDRRLVLGTEMSWVIDRFVGLPGDGGKSLSTIMFLAILHIFEITFIRVMSFIP